MPRTRYLNDSNFKKDSPAFEFQTRSDSNGPAVVAHVERNNGPSKPPSTVKYIAVKHYTASNANGVMPIPGLEYDLGEGNLNGLPFSHVMSGVMHDADVFLAEMQNIYTPAVAINFSIEKALAYGDILLLASLAESDKTIAMIRQVYLRFYKFLLGIYSSVKHLSPTKAYQVISDTWLELRYGWRPLYYELENLAKLFHKAADFPVKSTFGRDSFEGLDYSFELESPILTGTSPILATHRVTVKNVHYKAGFNYFNKVDSRNGDALSELGLDLESLLSTAWELIPFSFILDMFVNVGSYLNTISWRNQLEPFNSYLSTIYDLEVTTIIGNQPQGVSPEGSSWYIDPEMDNQAGFEFECNRWFGRVGIYGTQSVGEVPHYFPTYFSVYNVGQYEFVPHPLMDEDGTVIDSSVHFTWYGTVAPGSYATLSYVCFPETRYYTYTRKNGSVVTRKFVVGVPVNPDIISDYIGSPADQGSLRAAARGVFEARLDSDGIYQYEGAPWDPEYFLSYENSLVIRGIPVFYHTGLSEDRTHSVLRDGWNPGRAIYISRSNSVTFNAKPITGQSFTFSGRHFDRKPLPLSDIDFSLTLDSDLSGGQIADLAIFGERLVTGLRKIVSSKP